MLWRRYTRHEPVPDPEKSSEVELRLHAVPSI